MSPSESVAGDRLEFRVDAVFVSNHALKLTNGRLVCSDRGFGYGPDPTRLIVPTQETWARFWKSVNSLVLPASAGGVGPHRLASLRAARLWASGAFLHVIWLG